MAGRFQFSIRFLLVATVAVAVGAAAARVEPTLKSALAMDCLTLLFATCAFVGVATTTGKLRTFWLGNAIVLSAASFIAGLSAWQFAWLAEMGSSQGPHVNRRFLLPLWCAAPVNGLFAVLLHWLFAGRAKGDA